PRYLEVVWAAMRSGLVITPINWHLTPAEMAYIVEDCEARSLVTSVEQAPTAAQILRSGRCAVESAFAAGGAAGGFSSYEDAVAGCPTTPVADECLGVDMVYSSGTTGKPKGGTRPVPDLHPSQVPKAALA